MPWLRISWRPDKTMASQHKQFEHGPFDSSSLAISPFLKWAGGKRWLQSTGVEIMPANFGCYFEPFLGGGAVFFSMPVTKCVLSDINADLITTYKAIKNNWTSVEKELKKHAKKHSDEYYYKVRSTKPERDHTKAAKFIYLNRTCWNGLYRVNLKGEFNVPRGTKNSVLFDNDNFEGIANRLSECEILCQDFEKTISRAGQGDFVFVDPPYTVNHNLNGFLKYNENIFSWQDQVRLRDCLVDAMYRGAMITVTNADHSSIRELYQGHGEIVTLKRASVISGKVVSRKHTTEILVRMGWAI